MREAIKQQTLCVEGRLSAAGLISRESGAGKGGECLTVKSGEISRSQITKNFVCLSNFIPSVAGCH